MRNSLITTITPTPTTINTVKSATVIPDDLTRIKGIAEAREQKLYSLNILTFGELIVADAVRLAAHLGALVTPAMVRGWQEQAKALLEA